MSLETAVEAVRSGEVVGMPTDTVYGIGVDPLNEDAVARLFELKGRPEGKPVGVLAADISQALQLAEIEGAAHELARQFWPGALTLVVRPRVIMADWVGDTQRMTIGIRVPDHTVALDLLGSVGPMAVTSANLSGQADALDDREARMVFGSRVAVYLEGVSPGGQGSTVVDATGTELIVLRQGPVSIAGGL
ncbi:MAG: L-threonylcarbamoyladenylate synthase [Acidimicrobiia bacterium]